MKNIKELDPIETVMNMPAGQHVDQKTFDNLQRILSVTCRLFPENCTDKVYLSLINCFEYGYLCGIRGNGGESNL